LNLTFDLSCAKTILLENCVNALSYPLVVKPLVYDIVRCYIYVSYAIKYGFYLVLCDI